ncbi:molybdenum cofactor biosynthesis protein MoaE [Chelatococcus composti]|uniref:Molybdopterin synthase catalytic subunit n=1 Tax=Chelatococcus composti TaxID=1743235 RepID=A0A841K5Y3_9HYPH|nr:molybdenum cofactor biosynthesis protein MoaE [Chelatococcus composti]MBB6167917.1 molybdopterin synthase catalytic subunit [Chelatococcus composti]MBS7734888.1 molybdenum cofactor biosynthesis protein MoaE [Chelatococcus composti]GGG34941.1 molybdenum cofactor biosynthesis protein MoaE [Chelatococcus composti]
MADIRVQAADFDVAAEVAAVQAGAQDVGAVVTFTGVCRSDGGRLAALELEHYPGMAEEEIARVAAEAERRWPLKGLCVIHRFGLIRPGENIVLVVTASAHRQAAFEAASFLMDYLKTRAPFWKKEHLADGTSGGWVAPRQEDDEATARWE